LFFRRVLLGPQEGAELFGGERRCQDYVAQRLSEACGNGEPWATDFATAHVHRVIARCVEREADPVAAVARVLRVDRSTAAGWVREATGR
jgi:hypothetical protein